MELHVTFEDYAAWVNCQLESARFVADGIQVLPYSTAQSLQDTGLIQIDDEVEIDCVF